ncbi:hypothetical protein [Variovorax arabinosiphilus]|uniref:hypothetical protein n=1 Tax=Variovorax arabinosiphilus TaxID=3053498 RepID=UPI0025779A05|nr:MULTISPECIES: hypothetical protein [unclassified Variovorax]MDM0123455.1 hypothetical protein [Variovorax sp. J2L1-78]MDM0132514.1 hypothetical protein [Variovorax sp. J2L1-63]MDM0236293.1 hypothetical protein [Variovorax sp. J2R1-6]
MTDHERALCTATARLLQAAGVIAAWGLGLSLVAIGVLALTGRSLSMLSCMGFGAVAIIGIFERYMALRLRLDVGLFDGLACGAIPSLSTLDVALQKLGLRQTSEAPDAPRALADRVQGARQLMQRHGIAVACQSAMFLLALLTQDLR